MSSLLSSRPSLFFLRVVATGESRGQGDGCDRAHRRCLPIAAVPHDTTVSGVVEVSNNTDRRVSVRNVERVTSDLSSLPRSLRAPNRIGNIREFALWPHMIWPNCAARSPVECARSSLKTRARTRPAAAVTRRADAKRRRRRAPVRLGDGRERKTPRGRSRDWEPSASETRA